MNNIWISLNRSSLLNVFILLSMNLFVQRTLIDRLPILRNDMFHGYRNILFLSI